MHGDWMWNELELLTPLPIGLQFYCIFGYIFSFYFQEKVLGPGQQWLPVATPVQGELLLQINYKKTTLRLRYYVTP